MTDRNVPLLYPLSVARRDNECEVDKFFGFSSVVSQEGDGFHPFLPGHSKSVVDAFGVAARAQSDQNVSMVTQCLDGAGKYVVVTDVVGSCR